MATSKNSKQMTTGKAFEYALLLQFQEKLSNRTNIKVIVNSAFTVAKDCFNQVLHSQKSEYLLSASFAVNFLIDIEPRLSNDLGSDDILELEILADHHGKAGDVRDVLAIRALQKWEIGVSAKNNHKAVKHSRLSADIDFGEKWLGINVSQDYFNLITPIFQNLRNVRNQSDKNKKWSELGDYHSTIYLPVLNAFMAELKSLDKKYPNVVAKNLVSYLVGSKDFYKVIKGKNKVDIYAYNLNGTLNLPFKEVQPKFETPKLSLPTKILDIRLKKGSKTTVIVVLDNDWTLSFRIHNASSKIEPSLKFDINLVKSPENLFQNTLNIKHSST